MQASRRSNMNDDSVEAKWETAIRDKVFTSAAYTFPMLDGTILHSGNPSFLNSPMTSYDDDQHIRTAFQDHMKKYSLMSVSTTWKVPGLRLVPTQILQWFEVNKTLVNMTLCDRNGFILFVLRRSTSPMRAVRLSMRLHLVGDVILERFPADGRLSDLDTDAVYRLSRQDEFRTEADFLHVYGTRETMTLQGV